MLPYSLVLTATGFALLTAAPGFIRAAAGMAVIGMGLSSTYPVILSILGTRYPSLSGTAFGIALAIALIGQTAMNGLMGMVFTYDNGIVLYPYIMIGSLAIMLVCLSVHSNKLFTLCILPGIIKENSRHGGKAGKIS